LGQTRDLLDSRLRGNDGHWIFGFLQEAQKSIEIGRKSRER